MVREAMQHRLAPLLAILLGCSTAESSAPGAGSVLPQSPDVAAAQRDVEPVEAADPTPAPPPALARENITADDGHVLALWAKVPAEPKGAIIFLHGRTWSARPDFDLQVPGEQRSTMDALAAEGYAAYALDLRGYGSTPRDASGWNTPVRAREDLATAIDWVRQKHGAAPAVLGWSLGALTAQFAAQEKPDSISALILFGYPRKADPHVPRQKAAPGEPARAKTTAKAAAEDFIAPGMISDAGVEAFVAACLEHDPVRSDWTRMDEWNALRPEKVKTPTLLIHGELDPYARVSTQAKVFERIAHPDRAYVIVAGGDHAAHLEDTGPRFVQAVVSFIERPRVVR